MQRLQHAVTRYLRDVPTTKLHQIRDAIFQDKQRATLATFAALLRAKEQDKDDILQVVREFAGEAERAYPWYTVRNPLPGDQPPGDDSADAGPVSYYTPLLDAIELYDFLVGKRSARWESL